MVRVPHADCQGCEDALLRVAELCPVHQTMATLESVGFVIVDRHTAVPRDLLPTALYFSARAQEAGLVPIADTRVVTHGHSGIADARRTMDRALGTLIAELCVHGIAIEELLIGVSLLLPGDGCTDRASPDEVAMATLGCLSEHVPGEVLGVVISAEALPESATPLHLEAICRRRGRPWQVSFMFGSALQGMAPRAWARCGMHDRAAQDALVRRADRISRARRGWPYSTAAHLDAA
jgi:fructose-bisphosphate aldolase class I